MTDRSVASHEHTWTQFPSLDGTRRKCACGRIEENDGFGWRVILSGRTTDSRAEIAARHLEPGDVVELQDGCSYEIVDVGTRVVFAHGGRYTFKADELATVLRRSQP